MKIKVDEEIYSISDKMTAKELVEELERQMRGEKDWHDRFIEKQELIDKYTILKESIDKANKQLVKLEGLLKKDGII